MNERGHHWSNFMNHEGEKLSYVEGFSIYKVLSQTFRSLL